MKKKNGFTLIEVLVVVIIIAALAGMVVPKLWPVSNEAKQKIAQGDIANIGVALKLYYLKNDRFPAGDQGVASLYPDYLEKPPRDPWAHDYLYRCPGVHNQGSYDIWSQGVDPASEADDVKNW